MKCAICGDEIKGKGKKLGNDRAICKDCEKSSAMIQTCDRCEKEYIATDMVKDDYGTFCLHCYKEEIRNGEYGELMAWEDWRGYWEEDEKEPNEEKMFTEWVQRVREDLKALTTSDADWFVTKVFKRLATEVAEELIKKVTEARKAA
jgi:hypothetical protein